MNYDNWKLATPPETIEHETSSCNYCGGIFKLEELEEIGVKWVHKICESCKIEMNNNL